MTITNTITITITVNIFNQLLHRGAQKAFVPHGRVPNNVWS